MVKEFPAAWNDSLVSGYSVLYDKTLTVQKQLIWNVVVFFLFMSLQEKTSIFQPREEIGKG